MDTFSEFEWFEAALKPVSEESPCGVDPRSDYSSGSGYFYLKDLRMNARNEERNALIDDEPLSAYAHQWEPLVTQIPVQLATKSKDLELLAWLIEGLVRLHGFRGMAAGYALARECVEKYWDDMFPMLDEDGIEARVSSLIGLNGIESEGALIFPIASIPLAIGDNGDEYAYWQYQQAAELERISADKKAEKVSRGAIELETIQAAVDATPVEVLQEMEQDMQLALTNYDAFVKTLDEACREPMASTYITQKIDSILSAFTYLCGDRLKRAKKKSEAVEETAPESSIESDELTHNSNTSTQPVPVTLPTNLEAREQAIETLQEVADFFQKDRTPFTRFIHHRTNHSLVRTPSA